ncbi:DNA helicase Pif1 like protein [Ganoderma leucocontextum]|nr:DNA helicase Pif1 like protein [Ganoderma leucocontextum]
MAQLNYEQHEIYDIVLQAIHHGQPHVAFIDGPAGRGKTFLVNAFCAQLHAEGRIILPTATSGYAAQLYPGGRTTHSTFKVCILPFTVSSPTN